MIKEIPGYPLQYATTDGLIFSKRTGVFQQKPQRIHKGYYRVNLRNNAIPAKACVEPVHKLVLETFVGKRPEGYVCRHLNGNALDNRLENLCWGTPKENAQDAIRHGTAAGLRVGERHNCAKLSNVAVADIRTKYKNGETYTELACMYGVSYHHIHDIINNKTRLYG